MGWLIFDGISVLYVLTLFLLLILIMAIFVQRQILRLRNNSARQRPNVSLKPIAKKSCVAIEQNLTAVETMRKSYLPRLTDCTMIGQHSNAPYVHRMIAVDEISLEIDSQMARINPELARQAGESTFAYLTRVRSKMPSLPVPLIQRIAYMHESARYRPQKFELKHLMELRSLLNQFVKTIAEAPVVDAATPATPAKGLLHHLGQKALQSKKRRSKFGGSDGECKNRLVKKGIHSWRNKSLQCGRLLAGCINEEQVSLLPVGSPLREPPIRLRRQSDSHRSLLIVAGGGRRSAMSLDGPRDPQRNRQFYEDRQLLTQKKLARISGSIANETTAVPVPSSYSKSEAVAISHTAAPPVEATTSAKSTSRISVTYAPPSRSGVGAADIGRLVKTTWNDLKELLGFVPNCMNGGTRTGGTTCRCPKLFEGALCDKRICLNGGKLERAKYGPVSWECKCPTPQYIEGAHCETVRCANSAPLRTEPNGSWWCDCSDSMFYSGRFCEEFSAPYAVFAVPLACLLLFALCIAVCQMDLCPRRRRASRHARRSLEASQPHSTSRSRRRAAAGVPPRSRTTPSVAQRTAVTQELLVAEDRGLCRRGVAYPQGIVAPYVIRLDTIPHFNPHMIGGVDPLSPAKPLEPPPSYEQAVSAPPVPQPPRYTETEERGPPPPPIPPCQPPPPNRQPPPPPSS